MTISGGLESTTGSYETSVRNGPKAEILTFTPVLNGLCLRSDLGA